MLCTALTLSCTHGCGGSPTTDTRVAVTPSATPESAEQTTPSKEPEALEAAPAPHRATPEVASSQIHIVPENRAHEYFDGTAFSPPSAYFTPTPSDVERLERALVPYLRGARNGRRSVTRPLDDYNRRYHGLIENDERFIRLQALCMDFDAPDWREPVMVDDGGDCFFDVNWSVENETFSQFMVNGEA
ncbi:MAG: hypothetical protein AAGF12_38385 [Myxococcota bacterium]